MTVQIPNPRIWLTPGGRRQGEEQGPGTPLMPAFPALLFVPWQGYIKQNRGALRHIAPTLPSGRCPPCSVHYFAALQSPTPAPTRRCAGAIPCATPAASNPLCRHSPPGYALPIERALPALSWDGAFLRATPALFAHHRRNLWCCAGPVFRTSQELFFASAPALP